MGKGQAAQMPPTGLIHPMGQEQTGLLQTLTGNQPALLVQERRPRRSHLGPKTHLPHQLSTAPPIQEEGFRTWVLSVSPRQRLCPAPDILLPLLRNLRPPVCRRPGPACPSKLDGNLPPVGLGFVVF